MNLLCIASFPHLIYVTEFPQEPRKPWFSTASLGCASEFQEFLLHLLAAAAAAAAKSLQSCPTLCDPIDGSPPGSTVPGILQARTLEWVAISFFNAWKWKVKVKSLSRVQLSAIPWTVAYQAPPSMGFSRHEYWSGVHCLLQGNRMASAKALRLERY